MSSCSTTTSETINSTMSILPYDSIADQAFGPLATTIEPLEPLEPLKPLKLVFDEDEPTGWGGITVKLEPSQDPYRGDFQSPRFPQPCALVRSSNADTPIYADNAEDDDMPPAPPPLVRTHTIRAYPDYVYTTPVLKRSPYPDSVCPPPPVLKRTGEIMPLALEVPVEPAPPIDEALYNYLYPASHVDTVD